MTFTQNHWSNEEKTQEYIRKVILPYIQRKRRELNLQDNHPALVIYDEFKGQLTDAVHSLQPCLCGQGAPKLYRASATYGLGCE